MTGSEIDRFQPTPPPGSNGCAAGAVDLDGRNVLVVGLGRTGEAAAEFLAARGAHVTVTDSRNAKELAGKVRAMAPLGVVFELGGHRDETFTQADLIVVSPGVPPTIGPLVKAREKGVPITGEIELASQFVTQPLVAVTGTNGKTTTTSIIGEICRAAGLEAFVGGNIGNPLIEYIHRQEPADVVVIEVSSFQLETAETLAPQIAVLLNVTPDHLDRHTDMETYFQLKARLFARQGPGDTAITNLDDPVVQRLQTRSKRLSFSRKERLGEGAYVESGRIVLMTGGLEINSLPLAELNLQGAHNQENVMAALLVGMALGLDSNTAASAAARYEGLSHRVQLVGEFDGVEYYNDSKGTNVGAVIKSLESFDRPIVLIAGGRDKGSDFSPLRIPVRERVKLLILLGEAREAMAAVLAGETETIRVADMGEAVETARGLAVRGDVVLLSPACASYDMFDDYAHRGRVFSEMVRRTAN